MRDQLRHLPPPRRSAPEGRQLITFLLLLSGKLYELMDLFVREVNAPAGWRNQGRVQAEPAQGRGGRGLLGHPLDAAQNRLAG